VIKSKRQKTGGEEDRHARSDRDITSKTIYEHLSDTTEASGPDGVSAAEHDAQEEGGRDHEEEVEEDIQVQQCTQWNMEWEPEQDENEGSIERGPPRGQMKDNNSANERKRGNAHEEGTAQAQQCEQWNVEWERCQGWHKLIKEEGPDKRVSEGSDDKNPKKQRHTPSHSKQGSSEQGRHEVHIEGETEISTHEEEDNEHTKRRGRGQDDGRTAVGAMNRMIPSVWRGTLQGPWWECTWDYEIRVEEDGRRCTQTVSTAGRMHEMSDAKVVVDETGLHPRVRIEDEETTCTGEMNAAETVMTGSVTQEGELGAGVFRLRRVKRERLTITEVHGAEEEGATEGGCAKPDAYAEEKRETTRGNQSDSKLPIAGRTCTKATRETNAQTIILCVALFSMPGCSGIYNDVAAQLMHHIDDIHTYEQRANGKAQMRIMCDEHAYEDMTRRMAIKTGTLRDKVTLYKWHRDLPHWYPSHIMKNQINKHNKTLACFTRYTLASIDIHRGGAYIFVDANDMVTPKGVTAMIGQAQASVCIDEVLQAKSSQGANQCYYLGGAVHVQGESVEAFNAAVAATLTEMMHTASTARTMREGNLAIGKWAENKGFDRKRVVDYLDQALLQMALWRVSGSIKEIVVRYEAGKENIPEQWTDAEGVVMLRGAQGTTQQDRGRKEQQRKQRNKRDRGEGNDAQEKEAACATKQYVSVQGCDRTCLMHAVNNAIGEGCKELQAEQFKRYSAGATGDWGTDTLEEVIGASGKYSEHTITSVIMANLQQHMEAFEERVLGLVMHTGEGDTQHWDALRVERAEQWAHVESLGGGKITSMGRKDAVQMVQDRATHGHRVIAICRQGENPMRDIRKDERQRKKRAYEANPMERDAAHGGDIDPPRNDTTREVDNEARRGTQHEAGDQPRATARGTHPCIATTKGPPPPSHTCDEAKEEPASAAEQRNESEHRGETHDNMSEGDVGPLRGAKHETAHSESGTRRQKELQDERRHIGENNKRGAGCNTPKMGDTKSKTMKREHPDPPQSESKEMQATIRDNADNARQTMQKANWGGDMRQGGEARTDKVHAVRRGRTSERRREQEQRSCRCDVTQETQDQEGTRKRGGSHLNRPHATARGKRRPEAPPLHEPKPNTTRAWETREDDTEEVATKKEESLGAQQATQGDDEGSRTIAATRDNEQIKQMTQDTAMRVVSREDESKHLEEHRQAESQRGREERVNTNAKQNGHKAQGEDSKQGGSHRDTPRDAGAHQKMEDPRRANTWGGITGQDHNLRKQINDSGVDTDQERVPEERTTQPTGTALTCPPAPTLSLCQGHQAWSAPPAGLSRRKTSSPGAQSWSSTNYGPRDTLTSSPGAESWSCYSVCRHRPSGLLRHAVVLPGAQSWSLHADATIGSMGKQGEARQSRAGELQQRCEKGAAATGAASYDNKSERLREQRQAESQRTCGCEKQRDEQGQRGDKRQSWVYPNIREPGTKSNEQGQKQTQHSRDREKSRRKREQDMVSEQGERGTPPPTRHTTRRTEEPPPPPPRRNG